MKLSIIDGDFALKILSLVWTRVLLVIKHALEVNFVDMGSPLRTL